MLLPPSSESLVWIDNQWIPWQTANISITAHHYGIGVYEGVRSYQTKKGPAIFRLQDHTKRFLQSAHILNIPMPFTYEQLIQAQCEVIRTNQLTDAYIRPFLYYDGLIGLSLYTDENALKPHVMVLAASWNSKGYHQKTAAEEIKSIQLQTSSLLHNTPLTLFVKAKANGNYMNAIMALKEARKAGADDALLVDHQGYVAEATGANIFLVRNNMLYTPEPTSSLAGITRDTVFILAKELGLEVKEKQLTRDEFYIADEVFLTGTAVEITPVFAIDQRKIGKNKIGPLTEKLRQSYLDYAHGEKEDKYGWLTYTQSEFIAA